MAKKLTNPLPPWKRLTIGKDKRGDPRVVFVNMNQVAYVRGLIGGGTKIYFVSGEERLVVEESPDEIIPNR
jgi:hypothetical protein